MFTVDPIKARISAAWSGWRGNPAVSAPLWLRARSMSPEIRRQVDINQLDTRARLNRLMAPIGLIVVGAIMLGFNHDLHYWNLDLGLIFLIVAYAVFAFQAQQWIHEPDKARSYASAMRRFQLIQLLLGFCWSLVIIIALRIGDPDQRGMIYALAIALISTTMITGPARYALSFWVPITLGSYIAFIGADPNFFAPILVALAAYSVLSLYSILSLNAKMFERELALVEAANQRDTISLLLRDFQEGSGSFLWESDASLRVIKFSDQLTLASGPIGNVLTAIATAPGAQDSGQSSAAIARISSTMREQKPFKEVVIRAHLRTAARWWALSGKPIFDADHRFTGYRGLCADVTDREDYRQRIEFNASRDYLTKTYNRAAFNRILGELCAPIIAAADPQQSSSALLCLDLDRFKAVNDSYGHTIGDRLLLAVASRIGACVRTQDYVFRLGGDEFAVLLPHANVVDALNVADRLINALGDPFRLTSLATSVSVTIGASIGIALTPTDSVNPETLHHYADLALYRAKSNGGNHCCCYDGAVDAQHSLDQAMQIELIHAVERQQLTLAYQPIIDLKTGAIVAAEALLRWTHPVFGTVPPTRFVPMLEQIGQVNMIGAMVQDCALRTASLIRPDIAIAVNLSALQLADPDLPNRISAGLAHTGVAPARIEFEVTETSLLDDDPNKLAVLHAIHALGCRISLDDFGTGYSSMRLLDRFPFDKLKIDGSFIHGPTGSERRTHILASMIQLGQRLGLTITGEGIETPEQAAHLTELGCTEGQGFLFHRPIPSEQFRADYAVQALASRPTA